PITHKHRRVGAMHKRRSLDRVDQAHWALERVPEHRTVITFRIHENQYYFDAVGIDRMENVRCREQARSTGPSTVVRCAYANVALNGEDKMHGMMRMQLTSRTRTSCCQHGRPGFGANPSGNHREAHTPCFSRSNSHQGKIGSSFKTPH